MNELMRSCAMGLILSLFSSPLPEVQKEPVAYLYNGVILPALPEWDRETYPYLVIDYFSGDAYACHEVPTAQKTFMPTIKLQAPYLHSKLYTDYAQTHEYWQEWVEMQEDGSFSRMATYVLSSCDILYESDGSVYASASPILTPTPMHLPITLFDGTVTTEQDENASHPVAQLNDLQYSVAVGDTLRITYDGNMTTHTIKADLYEEGDDTVNDAWVGNPALHPYAELGSDDGDDMLIYSFARNTVSWYGYLATRAEGAHSLKIELIAIV